MNEPVIKESVFGACWKFPPTFSPELGVEMSVDNDDVYESMVVLFNTQPGERIMLPDYGCDLQAVTFANISDDLVADITRRITDSVLRYESRVELEAVEVERARELRSQLWVHVVYRLRGMDAKQRVSGLVDIGDGRSGLFL